MTEQLSQGDIIKIQGFSSHFLIVSNNAFINATRMFHVCPFINANEGPLHIRAMGINGIAGTAVCEQLKIIDPEQRRCRREDRLPYDQLMNISDAIQGIFEYD